MTCAAECAANYKNDSSCISAETQPMLSDCSITFAARHRGASIAIEGYTSGIEPGLHGSQAEMLFSSITVKAA